jgi:YidC/Oxa1 family membrane protein insertase
VVILYRYPAGLLVYWITTNLWTIGQQMLIKRHMGAPAAPPGKGSEADGKAPPNGKPTQPRGWGPKAEPALAGVSTRSGNAAPPPRSPRKKKKRSGRRR